eukprot:TRINITY_DN92580_c0_g1_i1.p1 TRINITY_DN92580_c0_g1~~TRINITY_DN92580_c0_g1_i1.p1  ORF type:complete len:371 (-),score=61.27 TRINITY_DN92580_c0_g1_i1:58-1170(-)
MGRVGTAGRDRTTSASSEVSSRFASPFLNGKTGMQVPGTPSPLLHPMAGYPGCGDVPPLAGLPPPAFSGFPFAGNCTLEGVGGQLQGGQMQIVYLPMQMSPYGMTIQGFPGIASPNNIQMQPLQEQNNSPAKARLQHGDAQQGGAVDRGQMVPDGQPAALVQKVQQQGPKDAPAVVPAPPNRGSVDRPSQSSGRRLSSEVKSQELTKPLERPEEPSPYTTVMLRNIPNKCTREMLIMLLNVDFPGGFDFVYLPIDFKNKCNVGYAFVNFVNEALRARFVEIYEGVEMSECFPGLNAKRTAEVFPARVQGVAENVARLRNSPMMEELVHHPEWMPLLISPEGQALPFPAPDEPLRAMKPRRRNRVTGILDS